MSFTYEKEKRPGTSIDSDVRSRSISSNTWTDRNIINSSTVIPLPDSKNKLSPWSISMAGYTPKMAASPKSADEYVRDPDINDSNYQGIRFNEYDLKYKVDRYSLHGLYSYGYVPNTHILAPLNPMGRTGLYGRGELPRWGPNQCSHLFLYSIDKSDPRINPVYRLLLCIRNGVSSERSLLGGSLVTDGYPFVNILNWMLTNAVNAKISNSKIEPIEALSSLLPITPDKQRIVKNGIIYSGYIDDTRNTDNAWVETNVYFRQHTSAFDRIYNIKYDDPDISLSWVNVSDLKKLNINKSHMDIIMTGAKVITGKLLIAS